MNQIDNCSECYAPMGCECPDIIWDGQITVDTTEEGVIKLFAPDNSTVTSTDDSIEVVETTNSPWSINYDLSVNAIDKKVWACNNDPLPGTLDDKLFVTTPLTKSVQDCETNGKVVLWINTNLLKDEKVKVWVNCPSVYLEDAIQWVNWVRTYKDWCVMKIDVDKDNFAIPFAKVMLSADCDIVANHINDTTGDAWRFFLPTWVSISNNPWRNDWLEFMDVPTALGLGKWIKIKKSWYYRVSFGYGADINYGISAMRGCVLSTMDDKFILLDDKIWEPSWYAINHQATANARFNIDQSKQVSFTRSDTTYLEADTRIALWWRISAYVTNWPWSWAAGRARIRRAWLASWSLWLWVATENSEAGAYMSVERVSDKDWWLLYI